MDRYRVQRRRTRRLEARAFSSRAWVVVMLVERTDRIFSNEAVEESSFYKRRKRLVRQILKVKCHEHEDT